MTTKVNSQHRAEAHFATMSLDLVAWKETLETGWSLTALGHFFKTRVALISLANQLSLPIQGTSSTQNILLSSYIVIGIIDVLEMAHLPP